MFYLHCVTYTIGKWLLKLIKEIYKCKYVVYIKELVKIYFFLWIFYCSSLIKKQRKIKLFYSKVFYL